ncbi:MAG: 5-formyltetrahydrofolate cyclo-ligase [Pseudomonadota bacterium]|nr:5-formyltetrahydrofolate cyclo-ligase [Pseudomonadota bacterium]
MADISSAARASIMEWRRAERSRQIESRLRVPVAERQEASAAIATRIDAYCRDRKLLESRPVVSGYWPLRGEPDLRPWLGKLHDQGLTVVLPVVVEKATPLRFRRWYPGCAMEKGFWNIPVPAALEEFTPQVLLAPVVAWDPARCYRLGYGGGYFDRTLASLDAQGASYHTIGVGYAAARLNSFEALPHDIRLDVIVTENALIE